MRCQTPENIARKGGKGSRDRINIPCGHCAICRNNRREEWTIRLIEESKDHPTNVFITLTYETQPKNNELDKQHLQAFFKQLRKKLNQKIRYYAVGEYGSKTQRPHYHALLFNVSINDINHIDDSWSHGFTRTNKVNIRRIAYTAKYHVNRTAFPEGLSPPFALMSKGIGRSYVDKMKEYHEGRTDKAYYQMHQFKKRLPRYYTDKLYTQEERAAISEISCTGLYDKEQIENFEKKYPKESYFTHVKQKLENHERQYREKTDYNSEL